MWKVNIRAPLQNKQHSTHGWESLEASSSAKSARRHLRECYKKKKKKIVGWRHLMTSQITKIFVMTSSRDIAAWSKVGRSPRNLQTAWGAESFREGDQCSRLRRKRRRLWRSNPLSQMHKGPCEFYWGKYFAHTLRTWRACDGAPVRAWSVRAHGTADLLIRFRAAAQWCGKRSDHTKRSL